MQYEMFKAATGQWKWQLIAINKVVIACSGEGYWNEADCMNAITLVKASIHAPVYRR
jgi:uncharacterized protein YegP (UPF0339 family)